jgi:hypothetical protein
MVAHWADAKSLRENVYKTVGTPKDYFEKKFPTLPVELYRIIRKHDNWKTRGYLAKYF